MSTEACILSWLLRKPAHGYEIQQVLRRYSNVHPMTNVNVYPLLRTLEAKGWVSSRTELRASRMRRIYEITAEGSAEFRRWLTSPIEDPRPKTSDPVMLRILISAYLDRNLDWLPEAISDTREHRDSAAAAYERRKCQTSPLVQVAIEELIAGLNLRLAFLLRLEAAIGEERSEPGSDYDSAAS